MKDLKKIISEKKLFQSGMKNVIQYLLSKNINLEELNGLEIFGGNGDTDIFLAEKLKTFEIWEIDRNCFTELKKKFSKSKIDICNSIEKLENEYNESKFEIIVMDNPMNVYGPNKESTQYCEHFDILKNIYKLINKEAIVIFLVNKKPFFYNKLHEKNIIWKNRRKKFYGDLDVENLDVYYLIEFYKEYFKKNKLETIFSKNITRHYPHLDYFIFKLKKNNVEVVNNIDRISLNTLLERHKKDQ
jgi:hypothetical protein